MRLDPWARLTVRAVVRGAGARELGNTVPKLSHVTAIVPRYHTRKEWK